MKCSLTPHISRRTAAFSLVEVTIALGLVAFGLVVLFALLPTGLNMVRESADEGVAVNISTMVAADLQSAGPGDTETPRFDIPLTGGSSSGLLADSGGGNTPIFFDESGRWVPPGEFSGSTPQAAGESGVVFMGSYSIRSRDPTTGTPANALVMVSWPALATVPVGHVEVLVPLSVNPETTEEP